MTDVSSLLMLDHPVKEYIRRDVTSIRATQTVADALITLRQQQLGEKIVYIYVLDDADRLVGVLPTRRLLMSDPAQAVESIMLTKVVTIPEDASVFEACELFIQYRFLAFPVVDAERRLLGVVDVGLFTNEVFDVAEQQSIRDVFQLIGVHVTQHRAFSPWSGFRDRFPWLLCNIGGGLGCAFLAGAFEGLLDEVIALALFVPVVLALAESVSMQSMTIVLQGLHDTPINWRFLARSLSREFGTATLLGIASGTLVALVAWLWKRQVLVACTLGASIALSIVTACLLGVLLPSTIRAFKADPRIAAGPIVLATSDIVTLLFYFTLGSAWLR